MYSLFPDFTVTNKVFLGERHSNHSGGNGVYEIKFAYFVQENATCSNDKTDT